MDASVLLGTAGVVGFSVGVVSGDIVSDVKLMEVEVEVGSPASGVVSDEMVVPGSSEPRGDDDSCLLNGPSTIIAL